MDFWSWSLRLFRIGGITVRVHWTLLILLVYDLYQYVWRAGLPWWMAGVFIAVLWLSILLHEFGHALMARGVGGDCRVIVMWMMGGLAECDSPARPLPRFLVSFAGPAVTGLLAGAGFGLAHILDRQDGAAAALGAAVAGYAGLVNLRLLLFNLLPCWPLDGGRMLHAVLWPWFGPRRAMVGTIWVSYPICVVFGLWAILTNQGLALGLAIWLFMSLLQEHQRMRYDESYLSEASGGYGSYGRTAKPGLIARWQAARRAKAIERREREEAAEQEILDRLLEKVSEHGLPSLTSDERATLERISRHQRQRQNT